MATVAARITDVTALTMLLMLTAGMLAGCANPGRPPIVDRSPVFSARPDSYVVQPGDTLYSIAWRYELDVAGLASANGLRAPYTIYAGQQLRLRVQLARAAVRRDPPASRPSPASTGAATVSWGWPASAPVVRDFSASNKGVDFRLSGGDQVRTAAAGEVVYAGNGLGGYAHLVIVKHNDRFLSAYSFNGVGSVREGEHVKAGAKLARMPASVRDAPILHFEIREHGQAVNPRLLIGR